MNHFSLILVFLFINFCMCLDSSQELLRDSKIYSIVRCKCLNASYCVDRRQYGDAYGMTASRKINGREDDQIVWFSKLLRNFF